MAKHYAISTSFDLRDARRVKVRVVAPKMKRSKMKLPLDDKQIQWGIGHNLTWVMGMMEGKP